MATPKLKVYKLDKGYTSDNDNDIQTIVNDELYPIVDKSILPEDAYYLQGVTLQEENLLSVGVERVVILTSSGEQVQFSGVPNWLVNTGLPPVLLADGVNEILTENYVIDDINGIITFDGDVYAGSYPTNIQATFREVGNTSSTLWITSTFPMYDGL
jgi:hypothetical protein